MIDSPNVYKAMTFAYNAHHGQADKHGVPYIFHPMHLAEQMETESETIAALLHDVVEDTSVTLEDLVAEGFPSDAIDAVACLTHDEEREDYFDYLKRVKTNAIATKVKLADLAHNSGELRLSALGEEMAAKLRKKYARAKAFLVESAS
jgi:(p)ppGpp synthase/HD superfamily hydrolase